MLTETEKERKKKERQQNEKEWQEFYKSTFGSYLKKNEMKAIEPKDIIM